MFFIGRFVYTYSANVFHSEGGFYQNMFGLFSTTKENVKYLYMDFPVFHMICSGSIAKFSNGLKIIFETICE